MEAVGARTSSCLLQEMQTAADVSVRQLLLLGHSAQLKQVRGMQLKMVHGMQLLFTWRGFP
jgi:hypothetical protein